MLLLAHRYDFAGRCFPDFSFGCCCCYTTGSRYGCCFCCCSSSGLDSTADCGGGGIAKGGAFIGGEDSFG